MKPKILFIHFDLRPGGAERVLINLLASLDKEKYDITLLTLFKVGELVDLIPNGIRYKYVFPKPLHGFTTISRLLSPKLLYRIFIREKYDLEIAYIETSPTRILSGGKIHETKRIAWLHNEIIDPEFFIKNIYGNRKKLISAYNSFDAIHVVSKRARSTFKNLFPEIQTPCYVVHNVNNLEDILNKRNKEIEILLDKNTINFCSVGRICGQKGYDRLLRVAEKLNKNGYREKYVIYIIGKGPEREVLEEYIKTHDITNVHFLGFKDNPYKYLSKMDMFVCSSVNEGYSTAVTESVLLGVPVITTDNSGMDEILEDGRLGLVTENSEEGLYNGMKQLLDNPNIISNYKNEILSGTGLDPHSVIAENEKHIDNVLKNYTTI